MMHLNLDSEKRSQLGKEFRKLKTIEEKFNFWGEKLKIPYYYWPEISEDEYIEFKIHPENKKDIEEINTLTLNKYKERSAFSSVRKIFDLEEFKYNFNKGLEESANKKQYIEYEIKKVENLVSEEEKSKDILQNFFLFGYKEYYLNNNTPDFKRAIYELDSLISWNNGYVVAQYHQFLYERLKKPVDQDKISHIVQMLILDYLGFGKNIESNNKKAEVYSPLIRRDVETTRQNFSKLNGEKNVKNLNIVLKYFIKAGCSDQVKLVEKDIDRINKRK